ncbi:hypothetical protein Thein_1543 [Thermodesulfatator indicus DSM 15286]|uniref:Alginate export domain-containing protein n=1 Tax=Thermodesulfatator indicus (strain DSM 15286 / JCM 11887 / CIR29812) TaxID=667014 RepID=F8AAI4_THEID|nr:DUF1302 family protein [Thermodesulfatator indicus]AEH45404.1 hypothetical protein Thein_1543 [Thermodesulfatator indicus DSM 15286]
MVKKILLFALLCFCFSELAYASDIEFSGRLWGRGAIDLHNENPFEDQRIDHEKLRLEAKDSPTDYLDLKASVELDRLAYGDGDGREQTNIFLWETYLRFVESTWEVTLGNQLIRWGKVDELTILDNLTWQDLRELFTLPIEERQHPWPWLRVQYFGDTFTLEGVFTLWPLYPKRDDFGSDWAVFDHLRKRLAADPTLSSLSLKIDKNKPSPSLRNSEWGLRLSGSTGNIDWEVSYLYAHDRSFYYYVKSFPIKGFTLNTPSNPIEDLKAQLSNLSITGDTVYVSFPRDNILGFAFETTYNDVGIRGEFAYHTDRVFLKKNLEATRKPYWRYVLGLDYSFENGLYINLQFLQQRILGWSEDILFDPKLDSYIFMRISKSYLEDYLEVRLDGTYGITTRGYYLNPEISYKINDDVKIFGGLHLIDGPKGTFFDVYDANDQVYLGLEIVF